jgi:hypothetical protein
MDSLNNIKVHATKTSGHHQTFMQQTFRQHCQLHSFGTHCHVPQGYRYELWCLARAAGVKYCMVS